MRNPPKKRQPKSKEQLVEEVRTNQKVHHQRELLRKVFAVIDKSLSINDAAAHIDVLAGLVLEAQKKKTNEMKIADLIIDLSPKAAPHPELIQAIYDVIKDEKAPDEVSALLVKFTDHVKFQVKEVAFIEKKMEDVDMEAMLK